MFSNIKALNKKKLWKFLTFSFQEININTPYSTMQDN